ncbi:WD40 repeat-like protein [Nadsonia fulvescens var. elongata DSM 6958]|uniref:WD40 repeat-like protein n=1 Tax=Nadsonia fulvescens var. elongata DSM 6958 TaxID=857566 RepID=A0A1E3PEH2_9ASCO|nr:WD40 repeat-like protein [Nadsonia fulvescens var. elongata DSM 6958]
MIAIDNNVVATSGSDGVKLWDIRVSQTGNSSTPQSWFKADNGFSLLCLDYSEYHNKIVAGTELKQVDSGIIFWDPRKTESNQVLAYLESHNDDVTTVKFDKKNQRNANSNLVLSGATDGLINIYDITIEDEDDAVLQTINHGSSIHSAGFINGTKKNKIYALSHMETFSLYDMSDFSTEDMTETKPIDLGDMRAEDKWDCEYVVDIYENDGFVAVGNHSRSSMRFLAYDTNADKDEFNVNTQKFVEFQGAHGEEIVRTVYVNSDIGAVYSGGEDGELRVWKINNDLLRSFQGNNNVIEDVKDVIEIEDISNNKEKKDKKEKKEKKEEKKEGKEGKEGKERKER